MKRIKIVGLMAVAAMASAALIGLGLVYKFVAKQLASTLKPE